MDPALLPGARARGEDRLAPLIAPLLLVAAALRLAVDNVAAFSRADETFYLVYTQKLVRGDGYPSLVRMFVGDPASWVFPNPLRWSYLGATSGLCSVVGTCTHHTLAIVSTVAGILAVALTYWIGRQLLGTATALVGALLVVTSPLQLALGRRALADELFCAAVLASLGALLEHLRAESGRARAGWLAGWVVTTTLAIAAKEQFLFLYPVILLFWWLRSRAVGWREVLAWCAPPLLFAGVFCALARDVGSFFRIVRIITGAMDAPYAAQFQSGPPQRLLIDSIAIAPIVTLVAVAAAVAIALRHWRCTPEQRDLAVLAFGMLLVHALVPSQNLRYVVAADAPLRLLVAAFVVSAARSRWALGAGLLLNAMVEGALFQVVFVAGGVYDPVTAELLRALRMLPR